MRRTLAVLVTAGAFLVPAGAASAADTHENASCSNGRGGNYGHVDGHTYNGLGNTTRAALTGCVTSVDPKGSDKLHGWVKKGDPVVDVPTAPEDTPVD